MNGRHDRGESIGNTWSTRQLNVVVHHKDRVMRRVAMVIWVLVAASLVLAASVWLTLLRPLPGVP